MLMLLCWVLCAGCALFGLRLLFGGAIAKGRKTIGTISRELEILRRVVAIFHEIQETLESGVLPEESRWKKIASLPAPWGEVAEQSIRELRDQGASIIPTLKRLRQLAEYQDASLKDAKAKSAQSLAQALLCMAIVPFFSFSLYFLLPSVQQNRWKWMGGSTLAVLLSALGALWMIRMADHARWAGLSGGRRSWILFAQCFGERILSMLRCGMPPDIAWMKSAQFAANQAPELVAEWGSSVWEPRQDSLRANPSERAILNSGHSIRRSIQTSLMEGRPCSERVEAILESLRIDLKTLADRELVLLPTRAFKPLFLLVAPALLGLMAFGMFLAWLGTESPAW